MAAGSNSNQTQNSTLGYQNWINHVKAVPAFSTLSKNELEKICHGFTEENYQVGDILCTQGAMANKCFIILEGRVAIRQQGSAEYPVVAFINANQLFGAKDMFNQQSYSVIVSAVTAVYCLAMDLREFQRVILPVLNKNAMIAQIHADFINSII